MESLDVCFTRPTLLRRFVKPTPHFHRPHGKTIPRDSPRSGTSSRVVITVHGELDASNASQLADYFDRCIAHSTPLMLDLSRPGILWNCRLFGAAPDQCQVRGRQSALGRGAEQGGVPAASDLRP